MALPYPYVAVDEVWEPGTRQASVNEKWEHTYTRIWRVKTAIVVGGATAGDAPGIPRLYQPYFTGEESDFRALVLKITPAQDPDDPLRWFVTVEYGPVNYDPSKSGDPSKGGNGPTPPTLRPPDVRWSKTTISKAMLRDVNDRPVKNSAGDRFDPPPETRINVRVLTYARNEGDFDPTAYDDFLDTVNAGQFLGYGRGNVKCEDISAEYQYESGWGGYYRVTYVFHCRTDKGAQDSWAREFWDAGFRYLKPPGGGVGPPELRMFRDTETGAPYSSQSALDGNGAANATNADPVYLIFREFPFKDYTPLNIVVPTPSPGSF